MPPPDITYYLQVQEKITPEVKALSLEYDRADIDSDAYKVIRQDALNIYKYSRHLAGAIERNVEIYREQEQALLAYVKLEILNQKSVENIIEAIPGLSNFPEIINSIDVKVKAGIEARRKYIEGLWWWNWIWQSKPRNEIENIKYIKKISKENQELQEFFNANDDFFNTIFGIYASSYATIMFVEKILIENYAYIFTMSTPAAIAVVGIAIFNLLLDKFLFDYFWKNSTLDDRENVKLLMLVVIAAVCIPLEIYVIPIALVLYTAGYFMNYMLQKGNIAQVINKMFFTQDDDGVHRWFEGFAIEANAKFNNTHYAILYFGTFGLSALYGTAMATLAAMWIYPAIAGFATLAVGMGFAISPLGLLICLPLVAYGVLYALFTAQAWARLVGQYVNLTQNKQYKDYGYGEFLLLALGLVLAKLANGIIKYIEGMVQAYDDLKGKSVLKIVGSISWGVLSLTWKLIQISLSILTFYGMYYMLDQACQAMGEFVNNTNTGNVLTPISYTAQAPVMLQQSYNVAKPEEIEKTNYLPWYSEMRISLFRLFNAMRVAYVPNGGELASSSTEQLVVASTGGASFVLVDSAMKNARKELPKTGDGNVNKLRA